MFKRIASFCLLLMLALTSSNIEARTKNGKKFKKKKNQRSSKIYKTSKNKRKSKLYKIGNGPDLKTITTESHYTEDTNNGINPIETKQPGI